MNKRDQAKQNDEFFGISNKNERQALPEHVQELLISEIAKKESALHTLDSISYLPEILQIEQIENEIRETNKKLSILTSRYNFSRDYFHIENSENWNYYELFANNDFFDCFRILNDDEYQQYMNIASKVGDLVDNDTQKYLNYIWSEKDLLKTLPKFDLLTDYLALIAYYNYLMVRFSAVTPIEFIEQLPPQRNEKKKPELPQSFELLFDSIAKYKKVMEILVSKMLIHSHTYIWKDESKANKSYLAALIKDLHGKKYYKNDIKPTNEQIEAICKNSFGWSVGIDTIKRTKATDFDFSFIPLASTIE
jgi:hypothetical protein